MTPTYDCDHCGACCEGPFIIEADELDVMREPRLLDADPHHRGKTVEQMLEDMQEGMAVILGCGGPCAFHADSRCSIYPTRPNCCVGLQPGDEQCQEARACKGLPPLEPRAQL